MKEKLLATGRTRYSQAMRASLGILILGLVGLVGCGPTIGDPCTTNTDCGPGVLCINKDYSPGGYCTISCKLQEPNDTCPTGSTCVKDGLGRNTAACFRMCNRQTDCRNGYACRPVNGSVNICVGAAGF